jgi:aspartate racemase
MGSEKYEVIGIVGGMGPQAGLALYENIINNTPATTDQEHLSVILMAFPGRVDDRTLFLEGKVPTNPAYEIVRIIEKLTLAGAKIIGIACNTSHSPAIFDIVLSKINKFKNKPVLVNMPREVCNYLSKDHAGISRIGVMTTNGTYNSGFYTTMLQEFGYEAVIPDPAFQDAVIHRMIYDPEIGIKANPTGITREVMSLWEEAMAFFRKNNAGAIILGCTELSLVLKTDEADGMPLIDSTKCLAKALIREAMARSTAIAYGADKLISI